MINRSAGAGSPRFMSYTLDKLQSGGAEADCYGLDQDWTAPLVWFDAPTGFGEEVWVSEQPDT